MNRVEQDTLCEKLATIMEPVIGNRATELSRLLMRVFRNRLQYCNEEQYTQLFLETSALATHITNAEDLKISKDQLPDLQLILTRIRSIH